MWEADDSQDLWATPGNSPAASMAHGERMVGSELTAEDLDVDRTLRPQRLDDYCGQEHIKQSLRVLNEAAQSRGETLDHVIFSGPPGLGKTTLATVIANELGAQIKTTSGPAIARTGDLAAILTNLQPGDVLFIDEIHRLNRSVEEVLYPAMEDFALDIVIGKGPAARSIRLDIPKFTLVAATTRSGMLTGPLRDRFGISYRLDYYTVEELAQIVTRSATILGVAIDHPSALEIGSRSRGTPRLANRLLKRVRDQLQVYLRLAAAGHAEQKRRTRRVFVHQRRHAVIRLLLRRRKHRSRGARHLGKVRCAQHFLVFRAEDALFRHVAQRRRSRRSCRRFPSGSSRRRPTAATPRPSAPDCGG